jgi:hypothetical protein
MYDELVPSFIYKFIDKNEVVWEIKYQSAFGIPTGWYKWIAAPGENQLVCKGMLDKHEALKILNEQPEQLTKQDVQDAVIWIYTGGLFEKEEDQDHVDNIADHSEEYKESAEAPTPKD